GKVAASCIHCHQLGEAQRKLFRADRKPIPDDVLRPWPMPSVIGFSLDPKTRGIVREVAEGSSADKAGLKVGDELVALEGQSVLSIADVQWVLHHAKAPGSLTATVHRGGREEKLSLALDAGWRRRSDISWRSSTWDL